MLSEWEDVSHETIRQWYRMIRDAFPKPKRGHRRAVAIDAENAPVEDIDISSILLQHTLLPQRCGYGDDELMLKFDCQQFIDTVEVGESVMSG